MKRTQIVVIEIRYKVIPKVLLEFNFDDFHGERFKSIIRMEFQSSGSQ